MTQVNTGDYAMQVKEKTKRLTLNIDEVAVMLGISRGSAFKAANRGELPVLRFGHRLLVSRAALEKMLRETT